MAGREEAATREEWRRNSPESTEEARGPGGAPALLGPADLAVWSTRPASFPTLHCLGRRIFCGKVVSAAQMPVTLVGTQPLSWTEPSVQERLGRQ